MLLLYCYSNKTTFLRIEASKRTQHITAAVALHVQQNAALGFNQKAELQLQLQHVTSVITPPLLPLLFLSEGLAIVRQSRRASKAILLYFSTLPPFLGTWQLCGQGRGKKDMATPFGDKGPLPCSYLLEQHAGRLRLEFAGKWCDMGYAMGGWWLVGWLTCFLVGIL